MQWKKYVELSRGRLDIVESRFWFMPEIETLFHRNLSRRSVTALSELGHVNFIFVVPCNVILG